VTDHDRALLAERIHQSDDIANQVQHVVGLDSFGLVSLAKAALIWSDYAKTCCRQRQELMPPRVP
jgi:hypothetical protein